MHVRAGPQFVITVRHSDVPDLARVRHSLEARPDLLQRGSAAIVHAILDRVHWYLGCPFALGLMTLSCAGLYVMSKRRDGI